MPNTKTHFWVSPKLAGETDLISDRTACGRSMYPDTGERLDFSEDHNEISCGNCARSRVVKNLIWFDTI